MNSKRNLVWNICPGWSPDKLIRCRPGKIVDFFRQEMPDLRGINKLCRRCLLTIIISLSSNRQRQAASMNSEQAPSLAFFAALRSADEPSRRDFYLDIKPSEIVITPKDRDKHLYPIRANHRILHRRERIPLSRLVLFPIAARHPMSWPPRCPVILYSNQFTVATLRASIGLLGRTTVMVWSKLAWMIFQLPLAAFVSAGLTRINFSSVNFASGWPPFLRRSFL